MLGNAQQNFDTPHGDLFRIGEVSRRTETKPFVLRYWETEFPMLQPVKTPKGHRLYRNEDIEMVQTIKRLLYDEGFTIAGARRHLADHGPGAENTPSSGHGLSLATATGNDSAAESGHGGNHGNGHEMEHREAGGNVRSEVNSMGVTNTPAAPHVLRELRQELAAILTLLRGR